MYMYAVYENSVVQELGKSVAFIVGAKRAAFIVGAKRAAFIVGAKRAAFMRVVFIERANVREHCSLSR